MYGLVPYLLLAAPPIIVLLSIMLGGCTATRTNGDQTAQARFSPDPDRRVGKDLVNELEWRETRAELQRIIDEARP